MTVPTSGHRIYRFECRCGHASTRRADTWPEKIGNGDTPTDASLARLRCSKCGRKGAPLRVLLVWDQGE